MNCQDRVFPSWNRRGGCASKKKARSLRSGADGVVIRVKVDPETLSGTDHPVCAFMRRLRSVFLMAQPPLLSEGEHPSLQFIHTFTDRRYSLDSRMKRAVLISILLLALQVPAWATWSIVAVDQTTGQVVIASATCVMLEPPRTLMSVQAVVVPGKGVAACQAAIDVSGRTQMLVFQEIQKGTEPQQIIRLLHDDPRIESKQFGIVDLRGRTA